MSRIIHLEDYKVSTTSELQEKVRKQKELEEKERNALKEYQYKFGKIRGFSPESPESTTLTGSNSADMGNSMLLVPSSISATSLENSFCEPCNVEKTDCGVNRKLDFAEDTNTNSGVSKKQATKPKLFQNLSFDEPLFQERGEGYLYTKGSGGRVVDYLKQHEKKGSQKRTVYKLRRFVCF